MCPPRSLFPISGALALEPGVLRPVCPQGPLQPGQCPTPLSQGGDWRGPTGTPAADARCKWCGQEGSLLVLLLKAEGTSGAAAFRCSDSVLRPGFSTSRCSLPLWPLSGQVSVPSGRGSCPSSRLTSSQLPRPPGKGTSLSLLLSKVSEWTPWFSRPCTSPCAQGDLLKLPRSEPPAHRCSWECVSGGRDTR